MSARINKPYSVGHRSTSGRMAVVCSLAVDCVGFSRAILNPALFQFRSPLPTKLRTQPATNRPINHQTKRVTGQLSPAQLRFDEDVVWVDNV